MNKTNREIVGEFRGLFKLVNKDAEALLSDRFILSKLKNIALLFVKQRTDRRSLFNAPSIFEQIPCVPLISVPIAECCAYQSDCTIKRSKFRLPKIAQGSDFKLLIQGLWSIDTISRRFLESDPNRYTNSLSLGLHTDQVHYWILDRYLYLGTDSIEKVKISACFEEDIPQELIGFPNYCGNIGLVGCCPASSETTNINDMSLCCPPNPYDKEFPCPGYLYEDVLKALEKEFTETYGRAVEVNKTTGITK